MHLSILSDCFLSDTLADTGFHRPVAAKPSTYRDGLLRGLAVVMVAAVLVGLTFLGQLARPAEAGPAPHAGGNSTGSALNALHREVTRL